MYEQIRNRLVTSLFGTIQPNELEYVLHSLDKIMLDYDVTSRSTELVIYNYDRVPEMLKAYISCLGMKNASRQTIQNYYGILRKFFIMVAKAPNDITPDDIRMFLYDYKRTRNCSATTLDKYRMYLSAFFTWAYDNEYIKKNPMSKISAIKIEKRRRTSLTPLELEVLRKGCITKRDIAIIDFFSGTGCRVSEVCDALVSDINWETREVRVVGKGNKERIVLMSARGVVSLRDYLANRSYDSPFIFVKEHGKGKLTKEAVERILKQIVARSGIQTSKHITPHVLRHTMATMAISNGMPIEEVSVLLGHESIATTMIYTHTDMESIRSSHSHSIM